MKIIHVSAELWPWAKVGGLGDAVSSMIRALCNTCSITIFIPHYSALSIPQDAKKILQEVDGDTQYTTWSWENCNVITVKDLSPLQYFFNNGIYPIKNIAEHYLYFCKQVEAYLPASFDVLHLHDWHTAYLAHVFPKKSILHIHNLSYQGKIPLKTKLNLTTKVRKKGYHQHKKEHYNLLKSGIEYATKIIFVSPTYSHEVLNKPLGCGLSKTLMQHASKISGVINGISYLDWNPETDRFIHKKFSENSLIDTLISEKEENKRQLLSHYGKDREGPLYVIITRLTSQKGLSIIAQFIEYCLEKGISCFLLGSLIGRASDTKFLALQKKAQKSRTVHMALQYDERLSHQLYASADYILVPSKFEPCGLVQMIAMRYGTIPIARKTGGLADTIIDNENGHLFSYNRFSSLLKCLKTIPSKNKKSLQIAAFKSRFTWEKSAKKILTFYNEIVSTSS